MSNSTDRWFCRRYATNLKGTFLLEGSIKSEVCTIVNVSRKGLGIELHTHERISKSSIIYIEVYPPREAFPINLKGTVKWIKQEEGTLVGGVELLTVLDEEVVIKNIGGNPISCGLDLSSKTLKV